MPAPSLTFVKPNLLRHLGALERLGVNFEFRRLGNDVFNELGWFDPSGHLIRLVEARTFSPSKRARHGHLLVRLFPRDRAARAANAMPPRSFGSRFGFVGMDEPDALLPHVSCTSDSINIGLYDPAQLRGPTLLFDAGDVGGALARLAEVGVPPIGSRCRCRCGSLPADRADGPGRNADSAAGGVWTHDPGPLAAPPALNSSRRRA